MSKIRGDSVPPGEAFDLIREQIASSSSPIVFPRSMLPHPAAEKLLETLGVTVVDDHKATLEDYARAWLLEVKAGGPLRYPVSAYAVRAVEDALAA